MDFKVIKALIWDWNGTLIDDVHLCLCILNSILQARDIKTVSLTEYREHFQMPVRPYYDRVGIKPNDEEYSLISSEFHDRYESERTNCLLCEHVRSTLDKFSHLTQCILSAHEQSLLLQTINEYKLTKYFSFISGSDNLHGKSKTEKGRDLLNQLKIKADETLIIGDTIHDFEVAQELGCKSILVSTGHYSEERLKSTGSIVINSLKELDAIFRL